MSVAAVALVLGALVVLLSEHRETRIGSATVCVLFGLVVALTPAGPTVDEALNSSGVWLWTQVSSL